MKNQLLAFLGLSIFAILNPHMVFAAENAEVAQFTTSTLNTLVLLASLVSSIFLIKGGYTYITSSGDPESLISAKKTIRNALIGLILVIGASTVSSILTHAFSTPSTASQAGAITLKPLEVVKPQSGLTQAIIDAVSGFLQNIIQSATKPLIDGIVQFLSSTPSVLTNSVIFNFWLVILGITDSLFAILIAVLGFQFMSASSFGFEEVELKSVLSRIFVAFLGANMSIFIVEWIINLCNTLVSAVIHTTGGISEAWVLNAFNPATIVTGTTTLITLIFMVLFVLLAVVLLLFYISRLILVSLGAVLSPLIFLLWALPPFAHFAEISAKTYVITVFTVFVHVVTIQLASSFLVVTAQTGTNSLISILVSIGLFFTLLKIPGTLVNMAFYTTSNQVFRKIGGQVMNVITANNVQNTGGQEVMRGEVINPARKVAL